MCLIAAALLAATSWKFVWTDWATQQAPLLHVTLFAHETIAGLGACQGVTADGDFVYLYGDAQPGVIREYTLTGNPATPNLKATGRSVALTKDGENVIAHPTGLAIHAELGVFLGNTVQGQGQIFRLDWPRALADENLDHAILNIAKDDAAVQGSRPCYVRKGGKWLIATSDYGNHDNALRLYDTELLATAKKTSEPGVCVASYPCGPWVQNLAWRDADEMLLFAQNQIAGLGWQLCEVSHWQATDFRKLPVQAEFTPHDELEGFCFLPNGRCIACSSSHQNNVWFGRVTRNRD
jgi:hypothetical protein